jgi:hypothetical protein
MQKPELIIMYTWDINGYYDNKVCGHMYEVIEVSDLTRAG